MGSRDDALDEQEFEKLLDACDSAEPKERLIILLAGELGMREGEIAHLKRSWINFQKGHIVIPSKEGEWNPKTRWGARTLPASKMSSRAWDAVRSYFTTYEALDVHRVTVYRIVVRVASRSDLSTKVYPHSLRATAATRVAYRIKNPQVLCDLFGWGQLSIAQYYIRRAGGLAEEELERAFGAET
jgi:integrase